MRIQDNKLLLGILLFNVLWWYGGPYFHGTRISTATALFMFLSGLGLMGAYMRGMLDIVLLRRRDEDDPGSHLAVFAGWLMGFGAVFSATFNYLWVDAGRPPTWVGTVVSNYGSVVISTAFVLFVWAPYAGRKTDRGPRQSALIILGVIGIVAAYWFGTQTSNSEMSADVWYPMDRPRCAITQPIWGVSGTKIFHTPSSAYRNLVIPDRCFGSEIEARLKGYRPPN